ncbi:DUF1080 domain-containing protein [Planctomycetales bacterium 10988]|nr:DUF1080 domain-containing protein [Planctomycetales bacterium 10988]
MPIPFACRLVLLCSLLFVGLLGCVEAPPTAIPTVQAGPGHADEGESLLSEEEKEAGFQLLFDGESLDGWEGDLETFRVEDGAIVAGSLENPIPQNEFLCTKERFDDFELRLKFKLVGEKKVNAGIQIRSERIPDHHEMIGYQADLGDNYWGALYDESRRRKVLQQPENDAIMEHLKEEEWNDYRILCEGKRIQLWINGFQTVDYTETDDEIPLTGLIGLQIHSGPPMEARYKDIRILKIGN